MLIQIPDPEIAKELGVVGYLLVACVMAGLGGGAFFLKQVVAQMQRMATAQEAMPAILGKLESLNALRFDTLEAKLDRSIALAEEHVRVAHMWERTEFPGRTGKPPA